MDKKIMPACLVLLVLFIGIVGIMGMPEKTISDKAQDMERQTGQSVKPSAAVDDGKAGSAGDYKYTIRQDGTVKILKYLKAEKIVRIPPKIEGRPVTAIGKRAFWDKGLVSSIEIPDTVKVIGEYAFSRAGIKEISIPEGVLRIRERAFEDCPELERIYISGSVKEIEGNIALLSIKLTKIDVAPCNAVYVSEDGVLYNKDMTEILAVPGGKDLKGFQFPDTVVCIGEEAFSHNASAAFKEFIIPDQVTTLKNGFARSKNLQKITIGKSVTEIGDAAFIECDNLSEVVITGRPKVIGREAFVGCESLIKVNIPYGVTEISEFAFRDCYGLKNIMIPDSVTKIGDRAFGYHEEGKYKNISVTGYRHTTAEYYARAHQIAFRDAENGKVISYDVSSVPRGKITKLTAGKRKIRLRCKEIEGAEYEVAVQSSDAYSFEWKKYVVFKPSAVIKGLKSGKQYKVKVRALRTVGATGYGKWSRVKKVTVW